MPRQDLAPQVDELFARVGKDLPGHVPAVSSIFDEMSNRLLIRLFGAEAAAKVAKKGVQAPDGVP